MSQSQQVEHTDSISSQDPAREETKKTKSRRPANTAFRQQRLKAWQPILTPKTVLPLFFIVGLIFAPIGGLLLWADSKVQELSIDYTGCSLGRDGKPGEAPETTFDFDPNNRTLGDIDPKKVSSIFGNKKTTIKPQWGRTTQDLRWPSGHVQEGVNVCILSFTIPTDVKPPILFYYRLDNFYQNHRRYVKSIDVEQLKGNARDAGQIRSGDCEPLDVNSEGKPYYPCGLIANSMFNDTFWNLSLNISNTQANPDGSRGAESYQFTNEGIAWESEGKLYQKTKYEKSAVVPPPNWRAQYPEDGYATSGIPDLNKNEAFQVWMRTAGLPTFSKLAMRNDKDTMKFGTYRLAIFENFPVEEYGGHKSILISTRTVMGGKNPFLGIAYLVVGGLCILLGAIFLATHLIKPRKLGDHTYLTWNNDQPSTATTTGRSARPGDA
ncbi:CDC50 family protein-like protein [Dendryphion nanum]|uniref:CDC50 family protein-like protein n=1 Tax=Dendryphion nanum TaxID=256645 RepID=A0A9P9DEG1_9PLEO|nr:CDC50 family protein-like protein [Dendryphion nanum]